VALGDANHRLRHYGRSRMDEWQTRRKTAVGESRHAVSSLESLRGLPERRKEEAIGVPKDLAGRLARRVETRCRRFLRLVRPGVRVLARGWEEVARRISSNPPGVARRAMSIAKPWEIGSTRFWKPSSSKTLRGLWGITFAGWQIWS